MVHYERTWQKATESEDLKENVSSKIQKGNLIMVLPLTDGLRRLFNDKKYFLDMTKRVSLAMSADGNTMIFLPF
jgi:hypothetical protein